MHLFITEQNLPIIIRKKRQTARYGRRVTRENGKLWCNCGAGIKKDTREQGRQEGQEEQEGQKSLIFLSFLFFLSFLSFLFFLSGAPRPQSVGGRRSAVDKKTHRAEGCLCQKKERVRSLLGVGEELAYRSATPKTLFICFCL